MSDLSIDPLEVKAEMLRQAATSRDRAVAAAVDAPDRVRATAVALAAFEERKDAIFRNMQPEQVAEVTRMAFGAVAVKGES